MSKENKKILVVSQNYYPEQFRITDICEELVKRGHQVTVLTGLPNYPQGKLYDGYENKQHRDEIINGVRVVRCYERERKSGGAINLFLNYYSFMFSSCNIVKKLDKDYDVVFINQLSPVMQARAGLKYKKKYGTRTILYCLDLWPASLSAGGIKRDSFIYNIYKKVSKKIYQSADKIAVTSKLFKKYFKEEFGFEEDNIQYLPQYAEDMFVPVENENKNETCNLVFAGNVGKMQNVQNIISAAKELKDENIMFHIVGGGSDLEECQILAEGLENIKFYGQRPLDEMPQYYNMADAMLVGLKKDDLVSLTLPGKVQTYMSVGKPIIAYGENELKNVIEEADCGYCASADDVESLKSSILNFVHSDRKVEMGKNARKYYEENFKKEMFFEKLEELFEGE